MDYRGKKLLIFGGVAPLKEIILDCKKNGAYTIITDLDKNAPAQKYADEFWNISVTDVDSLYQKCIEEKVDAVMNYCADLAQKPYQQLCEKLGIKCTVNKEQIDIMTNKDRFSECCRKYNVGTVMQYDLDEDNNIIHPELVEYPVIIKPVDNAASKGMVICNEEKNLRESIRYALSYSARKKVVIQKFMNAQELIVKYVACEGELYLTSMSDVCIGYTEKGERVHFNIQQYPSRYYDEYLSTTDAAVRNMLTSIGIKDGAVSLTGFYDNGIFRFFDPSVRMGGHQDWRVVKAACGLDISQMLTNFALTGSMGNKEEIKNINGAFAKKASALLYFDVHPGIIGRISGVEEATRISNVAGYFQCHNVGDNIPAIGTANCIVLCFILSCNDKVELKDTIQKVQSLVKIEDEQGESMVVASFDSNLL